MPDHDPERRRAPLALASDARAGRKQTLFFVLSGFFLTNALVAELIGGKLFQVPLLGHTFTLSVGILLWPVVFIVTDLVNEYFGRPGVKRLSILAAVMIAYAFVALYAAGAPTAVSFSPVDDGSFARVFFQSQWIIVGSIFAFLAAQLLDVTVFWLLRRKTGRALLWVRATGSTLASQLLDTFIVQFIGLHLPLVLYERGLSRVSQGLTWEQFVASATSGYLFKALVAVAVTPLLYLAHHLIDRALGVEAEELMDAAAAQEAAPS